MSDKSTSNSITNLSTTETICCCSIQNCQNCIQLEKENAQLKSELEQFRHKETEKLARFILIPNKLTKVCIANTCCDKKCIDKNIKYGHCISKNGYINVQIDEKVKYRINKWIVVFAQNSFKRTDCYSQRYSLFYFEIKMIKEIDNDGAATIGVGNVVEIYFCNSTIPYGHQKFSWDDGDVFGCGLVFPPNKNSFAIVFVTKNGYQIGNRIFLKEIDELCPKVGVQACSVETNFGYDLAVNPFIYDVNKHFI